jgi:formamidopyrimidine-DNA glycosylase
MPELPEVEVTCQGLKPFLKKTVHKVVIRNYSLRWPIPTNLSAVLEGQEILEIKRRAKYILVRFSNGTLLLHLGMSGHLYIIPEGAKPKKHDHVDFIFGNESVILRYNDPRRFGSILWTTDNPLEHRLLKNLGPEPLEDGFNAEYLGIRLRAKSQCIKSAIMDGHNVVGVGNIYASEALFYAGIKPQRKSSKLTKKELKALVTSIKDVINKAIVKGGSTMNDFFDVNGENGYFQNEHKVYGRKGKDCYQCDSLVLQITIGQRSSFFCNQCQK